MEIIISLTILIYSAILHEIAHGYVADRLGDPTARLLGRLTLNPVPHVDPFMTLAMPLLLILSGSPVIFGGAKPVPVDPYNLQDPKRDMAIVSLAGPLTNVLIAIVGAACIHLLSAEFLQSNILIYEILRSIVNLNLLLAIFNLVPIPPLDGSKVLATFLPADMANSYLSIGRFGMIILFILLMSPIGGFSLIDVIYNLLQAALRLLGL